MRGAARRGAYAPEIVQTMGQADDRTDDDPGDPPGQEKAGGWRRWAPLLLVAAVAALFLVCASPWIGARFGESHDGRNASVWGAGSRALRTEGVRESRFGGLSRPGGYADHPPGIIAETTLAERIAGEHRLVTRAPAWIGSLVAIALLTKLLIDAGLSAWAAAAGVAVACSSAMFIVYGAMLDTPVIALPFALAVLVLVQRTAQGRPPPWWALALAGAGTSLTGWAATSITMAAGLWLVVRAARGVDGTRDWRSPIALAAGSAVGMVITAAWIRWVYGSFTGLTDNAKYRSGAVTLSASLSHQATYLTDLLPIAGVIGCIGLALAATTRRYRAIAAVTFLPVVAYALVFKGGSEMHDYWSFALVVPLGLGTAVLVDRLAETLTPRFGARAMGLVVGMACLLALVSATTRSDAELAVRGALGTPDLLDVAVSMAPPTGPPIAYVSEGGANSPWISYESGRPGRVLADFAELRLLAAEQPDFPVLVVLATPDPAVRAALQDAAVADDGPWAIVRAADASRAYELGAGD